MTEKELKRLKKIDLLEMLLAQSKEIETLRMQLNEAEKQLQDRKIILQKAGSIAEAALQLNGVFEAAQKAAIQYLGSLAYLAEQPFDESKAEEQLMQEISLHAPSPDTADPGRASPTGGCT